MIYTKYRTYEYWCHKSYRSPEDIHGVALYKQCEACETKEQNKLLKQRQEKKK
jgi:hypothetical protein